MPIVKDAMKSLAQELDALTVEGSLCEKIDGDRVRCHACGHHCLIREGQRGICQVRFNRHGRLRVPWGYVANIECDPTEKKPYYHFLPGSRTLTFGMLGCDFHCPYCQNWITSQALRDPASGTRPDPATPEGIVRLARRYEAQMVGSSYNEPLITSEWAVDVFREAKSQGFLTLYVSNGNANPEVLDYLSPWLDGFKIDLKTMNDRSYRKLGGVLDHVLDTIRRAYEKGFWVEVVTLVVPGFNDSEDELREAARYLVSVSADIPWHLIAFFKNYRMREPDDTPAETLLRAVDAGKTEGLRYVYAGNLPGLVGDAEHTFCPQCHARLIQRMGFWIVSNRLTESGTCPDCGTVIPGIWWSRGQLPLYNPPAPRPAGEPAFARSGGGLLGRGIVREAAPVQSK